MPIRAPLPAWQTCLDVEGQDANHYLDYANLPLLDIVDGVPRHVLELGCSTGFFGLKLKERHPGACVVGIEAGRAAARIASARLDRVICGRIEATDFRAEGLAEGEFDTLVAADVLEHLVNPWDALVRIRPLLAPGGQLVASIPNVRNALLLAALLENGRWLYRERGLLDITHLRFFTLHEIRLMFLETGYRLDGHAVVLSPALRETFHRAQGQPATTLQFGRFQFANASPAELQELCAEQFLVRARPA